jgi:hypothetical protein
VSTSTRSSKEAKTTSKVDVVEATDGGIVPLTNEDYDLDDLDMLTKSPLMVSPPSNFFY